ncbi:hypothetical protein, conserved [Eimeria maxima]|uniref:Uncharacterized protein n=1 Tax=Eimeria maxima TaxID=5804 RepID=U6M8T4_EIMMA|nr:hypothetical protein, conserved [Eimeria maxima]CDJ60597.1 hypothetical protein, conserved [Eimeria maxima]
MKPSGVWAAAVAAAVGLFCCLGVSSLSIRSAFRGGLVPGRRGLAAAAALQQQQPRTLSPAALPLEDVGCAFIPCGRGDVGRRSQGCGIASRSNNSPQGVLQPFSNYSSSSSTRKASSSTLPLKAAEGPTQGLPGTAEEAADFESWGPQSPVDDYPDACTAQLPSKETTLGAPAGVIDVHFGAYDERPSHGGVPEGATEEYEGWRHLQLPLETLLFLAVDAETDAMRYLKEGATHMLQKAHTRGGGPNKKLDLGADILELRLAHALCTEAAAAAVQRRAAAQATAPLGTVGFRALKRQIDAFFEALYPRVAATRYTVQPQQQQQQKKQQQQQQQQKQQQVLRQAEDVWEEFRGSLFSHEELPAFEQLPVVITKGDAPLWEVRRATALQEAPGGPQRTRKLLLRLPELAIHEALLPPLQTPAEQAEGTAAATAAPATTTAAGAGGGRALRWAILCAMTRYRELLDPEARGLVLDEGAPQEGPPTGGTEGPLSFGLTPAGQKRRLQLLRTLFENFKPGPSQPGGPYGGLRWDPRGGLRARRAHPLWLLPMGASIRAWLEADSEDMSGLFHAAQRSGAAGDSRAAVSLLEAFLQSLDVQPPDLEGLEEEERRAQQRGMAGPLSNRMVGGPFGGPHAADTTSAAAVLGIPSFIEALILDGVDAAARAASPLMAQLNEQARDLAKYLGLPSAQGGNQEEEGDEDSSRHSNKTPLGRVSRAELLQRREEFLLLLNTIERRLLVAAAEALEGSILGGTGMHARRLSTEPQGPPPADSEEASVRTFIEAQVFIRDLMHTMRQTLKLPRGPGQVGGPKGVSGSTTAGVPVDTPGASIPFPSFDDLLTAPEGAPQGGVEEGATPVLDSPGALAAAAARLYAFFLVHCFEPGALPAAVRLRISRGLNTPTSPSLNIKREAHDGSLRAEWTIYIQGDIQHIPLLASSLLSSMFAIYKETAVAPKAFLPPGFPPLETEEETGSGSMGEAKGSNSCCLAVRRWQAIREAAQKNKWPFYVGLQEGTPLQLALAASVGTPQGTPGDPSLAFGLPKPLTDLLFVNSTPKISLSSPEGTPQDGGPQGGHQERPLLSDLRTAVPIGSPGSVSAALSLTAAETLQLLQAATPEERDKALNALENATAERYKGIGSPSQLLYHLIKEGISSKRALALLNSLVRRQQVLPASSEVNKLMAVSSPETAASPLAVPSPKVEGALAVLAKDWGEGRVPVSPLVHALWAGDRGAAAAAAAAGAVSAAAELGTKGIDPGGDEALLARQPLNTWAWKQAEKIRRDALGAAFLLRWLEGRMRGFNHSSDCLHTSLTGVDLRGIVGEEAATPPPPVGGPVLGEKKGAPPPPTPAYKALMQEGIKYLEDLHVIEHQHQHAQRQLTMKHLLMNGAHPEGLLEAANQVCAGLGPPSMGMGAGAPPLPPHAAGQGGGPTPPAPLRSPEGEKAHKEETERATQTETLLQEALRDPKKRIIDGEERQQVQMMLLMGRVYQPFTTLGVDTPEGLNEHITARQLVPLAKQYAGELSRAPLYPPSDDGRQRIQTIARPDPIDPNDPNDPQGLMSLSRFFEDSTSLPALLKESGALTGQEAAAQQQALTTAAAVVAKTAAAAQGSRTTTGTPATAAAGTAGTAAGGPRPKMTALHLVAAEAVQTVSSASPNPHELSPAAFLDALEFVQLEAGRHYARQGTKEIPIVLAAPGEEEEEAEAQAAEAEVDKYAAETAAAAAAAGHPTHKEMINKKETPNKYSPPADWRNLLSQTESIRPRQCDQERHPLSPKETLAVS